MNNAKLISVAGLPGSGKSTLFKQVEYAEFLIKDDIGAREKHSGKGWVENEEEIRAAIKNGRSAVVSDIELCDSDKRNDFEKRIGINVEWVYFENDPWKCALNCLYRYYIDKRDRPIHTEIRKIKRLSRQYNPPQATLSVTNKKIETIPWKCAVSCLHRFYCLDEEPEENQNHGTLVPDLRQLSKTPMGNLIDLYQQ